MANQHLTYSRRMKMLKNGAEHPHDDLMDTIRRAHELHKTHPAAFFELVKMCRFPNHTVHAECLAVLGEHGLLVRNEVTDIVKDVILSSVVGRTLPDLEIKSPLQENANAALLM